MSIPNYYYLVVRIAWSAPFSISLSLSQKKILSACKTVLYFSKCKK